MTDVGQIEKMVRKHFIFEGAVRIDPNTGEVSCASYMKLRSRMDELPVSFSEVKGYFDCSHAGLKTLKGSPHTVGGNFMCAYNDLEYLIGGPKVVKKGYFCQRNQLKSLKGIPDNLLFLNCNNNKLTSLLGGPKIVTDYYECAENPLVSLEGAPKSTGTMYCANTDLRSMYGMPRTITKSLLLTVHPNTRLLDLLFVQEIEEFVFYPPGKTDIDHRLRDLEAIFMRYKGQGYDAMPACAARMAKAGYGSNARMG